MHHHHHHDHAQSNRAFALAVGLNLLFTLIELVYAVKINSTSLLGDAGHNFSDVLALIFSWVGMWLLAKPATQKYSYGYKKFSILAAFANAFILLLTIIFICYDAIVHFFHPQPLPENIIMIIAGIGILINAGTALLFMRQRHHDLNIKAAFLHLAYDALISFGVVLAAIVIYFTKWYWLDPLVGIGIAVVMVFGTWQLLIDSVNLLLDAVPRNIQQDQVNAYLMNLPGVIAIHDLHIWSLSTQEIALTAHLVAPNSQFSKTELLKINQDMQELFTIQHVTLQLEGDDCENHCQKN